MPHSLTENPPRGTLSAANLGAGAALDLFDRWLRASLAPEPYTFFAALVVDGIDGTFARAARVKERLPRIDGDALDLIIDYITYVLIPALMIWRMGLLPQ